MTTVPKVSSPDNFLSHKMWEKTYGEEYQRWRSDRWTDSSRETQVFLNHVLPLGRASDEKRILPHQAESLQRIIYSFEHANLNPLMCTLATGTGKTVVMGSVIAWLACRGNLVNTFLLFCPNTIVRDRLKRDFETLSVFSEFRFFPPEFSERLKCLSCSVVDSFQGYTNLRGHNLLVANRHQFQRGYSGGNDHLVFLQQEGGQIAVFNDEAHNTRGKEYSRTLSILKPQTMFRLDVTATPDRADNLRPQSHEIYNLSVVEAITGAYRHNGLMDQRFEQYPKLIKDVMVQRPSIKSLGAIQLQELLFRDPTNNKEYTVREIDWEEWPKKKNIQLVMDPGGMKLQLQLSVEALERKRAIAKGRYKPLLFVIAPSILGAQKALEMMRNEFKLNPLLVVDDLEEMDSDFYQQSLSPEVRDKQALRDAAANLGSTDSPYDSVVSVYMLREGWDVPEVSVMCLLRGFGSPLFAHQVLGRGLRLIRRNGLAGDASIQELTVVDHPCLQLDDLWAEIDALVLSGGEVTRQREIPRDGSDSNNGGEIEPLPEQLVTKKELYDLLFPIPSPLPVDRISTERALELLESALIRLKDYQGEQNVIVNVEIDAITRFRPKREAETTEILLRVTALVGENEDREFAQKHFNKMLMDWANEYGDRYEPFATHADVVYKAIIKAFERHVFMGQSCTEVSPQLLFAAQHVVSQLKEAVTHELNFKLYAEEILQNE